MARGVSIVSFVGNYLGQIVSYTLTCLQVLSLSINLLSVYTRDYSLVRIQNGNIKVYITLALNNLLSIFVNSMSCHTRSYSKRLLFQISPLHYIEQQSNCRSTTSL